MAHKGMRYLLVILMGLGLVIGCVLLEALVGKKGQEALEQNDSSKVLEDGEVTKTGQELSKTILYEDEEFVCYEDRVISHFYYKEANTTRIATMVEGILEYCPDLNHVYVVPVPHRILVEEGYEEDKETYQKYMEQLFMQLPEKGILVPTLTVLENHKDEYIFFHTEDAWTARGAYYGTEALCNEMGLEPIPLEQYREYMYTSFRGGLVSKGNMDHVHDEGLEDQTYYYLLPETSNMVEVVGEDNLGNKVTYKKPIITSSARNLGSFIQSIYTRAIVEGEPQNTKNEGKYLLVICDGAGRLMVPYLKDYYDGVYVINMREDDELYHDLNEIVKEYHISDVLFAQSAMEMGVPGYSRALNDFCEE